MSRLLFVFGADMGQTTCHGRLSRWGAGHRAGVDGERLCGTCQRPGALG